MTRFSLTLPLRPEVDTLSAVHALISKYKKNGEDYYAYERGPNWHVALGSTASLNVNPTGTTVTVEVDGKEETKPLKTTIADAAREFVEKYSSGGQKVFGQLGFNYASHIRNKFYRVGVWPMLSLLVPNVEAVVSKDSVTIYGSEAETLDILALLKTITLTPDPEPTKFDASLNSEEYKRRVTVALQEIADDNYLKVIGSRAVDIPQEVDMPDTLLLARRNNSPKRSFSISQQGWEATGFSPELVLLLEDGKITTEPLAGTRSRVGTEEENAALKKDLLRDPKEIMEHVLSVRHAVEELESKQLCFPSSVVVDELMAIRERGPLQHLGSKVSGSINDGKDGWDAMDILFPAITASGIPKPESLEGIQRLEPRPRELYSGAVLIIDGTEFMEATLVLRTVLQGQGKAWIQAGAGILGLSNPERELEETKEKLASIAPFVCAKV